MSGGLSRIPEGPEVPWNRTSDSSEILEVPWNRTPDSPEILRGFGGVTRRSPGGRDPQMTSRVQDAQGGKALAARELGLLTADPEAPPREWRLQTCAAYLHPEGRDLGLLTADPEGPQRAKGPQRTRDASLGLPSPVLVPEEGVSVRGRSSQDRKISGLDGESRPGKGPTGGPEIRLPPGVCPRWRTPGPEEGKVFPCVGA